MLSAVGAASLPAFLLPTGFRSSQETLCRVLDLSAPPLPRYLTPPPKPLACPDVPDSTLGGSVAPIILHVKHQALSGASPQVHRPV